MNRGSAPLVLYVVSHTHWDREWYHTAARFRQRLIPLVDEVLAASPDEPPFLLDGQAIILEDYLKVRPAARERLARALQLGRVEAGPWYVLADELIPGGEALVRNLLIGRRVLGELGGTPPAVLYSPDAFGHPAALPLIGREFGCSLVILWRGLGGAGWPDGDTFRWAAPDESSVVVYHLPPDGYEFGSSLPDDPEAARVRWDALRNVLFPRARLGMALLLNGADHHAPQGRLASALAALAVAAAPTEVRPTGLREAAAALVDRAREHELPQIRGELRSSFGYTWSLQGTFAVRADLKRAANRLERELVRDVEPWLALARDLPGVPKPDVERAAWKTLLRCHPHDTLCGCSIDPVARAMAARLEAGFAESSGLRSDALDALVAHDLDAAAAARDRWRPALVVRNRAPRIRSGVAEVELLTFRHEVPVGPGSAFVQPREAPDAPVLIDGGRIRYQLLDEGIRHDRLEPRRRYPQADLVRTRRALAWIPNVPPYGITTLPLTAGAAPEPEERVRAGGVGVVGGRGGAPWLENDRLRLTREPDGSFTLVERTGDRKITGFVALEEIGDVGDTYTPSLVGPTLRETVPARVELVHAGPLRGELLAHYTLKVPAASARTGRSGESVSLPVSIGLVLDAGAPFVRVHVSGVNTARDHRLRIVLATGAAGGEVWADAAFGPVRRVPSTVSPDDAARERPLPTAPLHRYVTIADETRGATLYGDGSAEYEALPDGCIAVTLFRGVGELSRPDLPERPGHAGWPAPTPEAQCLGPFAAGFGLMLHGPRSDEMIDQIERCADDALLPLTGGTVRALLAYPEPRFGVELDGAGLAFGACKRSDDGEWLLLRCVNLLEREVQGSWRLGGPIGEARRSRLDESPGDPLPVDGDRVRFVAGPRAVVTLLVR